MIDQTVLSQLKQAGVSVHPINAPAFVIGDTPYQVSNIGFHNVQEAVDKTDGKVLVVYALSQLPIDGRAEMATLARGAIIEKEEAHDIKDWNTYQQEQGVLADIDKTKGIPKQ